MRPVEHALVLAAHGFPVFPCERKQPLTRAGFKSASTDPEQINRWWRIWPNAWTAVATGAANLLVIDCDTPKPDTQLPDQWRLPGVVDGSDVYAVLLEEHAEPFPHHAVRTPSGGWHFYYARPPTVPVPCSTSRIGPLLDVRADGGYVIGAGAGYLRYCGLDDIPPAPRWLLDLCQPERPHPRWTRFAQPAVRVGDRYVHAALHAEAAAVTGAAEGTRNDQLNRSVFTLARLDVDRDELRDVLLDAARTAGLDEREAERTIRSALAARG